MVVLVNPTACAGRTEERWREIEPAFLREHGRFELVAAGGDSDTEIIARARAGELSFVAAGGDGTVNRLINILAGALPPDDLRAIRIGAIGLGSSNDFHKPFRADAHIGRYPCRLNFSHAFLSDLGLATWMDATGSETQRCWINNASVGITAEANETFNHPPPSLQRMKAGSTGAAILYAAVRTIVRYQNISGTLSFDGNARHTSMITNLGIVRNPHFSGSFCYDTPNLVDTGTFYVHLCSAMSKRETFGVLYSLAHRRFQGIAHTSSFTASTVECSSENAFAVEFDGETIQTRHATLSLLRKAVQLCSQ